MNKKSILRLWPVLILVTAFFLIFLLQPFGLPLASWGLGLNLVGSAVVAAALFKPIAVIRSIATQAAVLGGRADDAAVRSFVRDRLLGCYGMVLLAMGFVLQLAP